MNQLKVIFLFLILLVGFSGYSYGQNAFNKGRTNATGQRTKENPFNKNRKNNFNDYRYSLNSEYAKKLGGRWSHFDENKGLENPEDDIKPVPITIWQGDKDKNEEKEQDDKEIVIEEVITPIEDKPTPSPTPIAPVKEDKEQPSSGLNFTVFGTPMNVRVPEGKPFRLDGLSPDVVSTAWMELSGPEYSMLLTDLLKLKSQYKVNDWEYLQLLDAFAQEYCDDINSATFLMAYLFGQSGYKIRLGLTESKKLDMLFASHHTLLRKGYYKINGDKFYQYKYDNEKMSQITEASFSKEQPLSLVIKTEPILAESISTGRNRKSDKYPIMGYNVDVNENIIKFYDTYPPSVIGDNVMTRWGMLANTPMTQHVKDTLYPSLKAAISGLSEYEAVDRLLNWVQTGFVYEYDDKVWGMDRAFFPEESLYYPYCDCEDRSILFTRLVRDLLGLDCILVYYPGHLASAVNFNDTVRGDYIMHNGKRFTIADATYIGAPVGDTMPSMDNSSAKVILLEK